MSSALRYRGRQQHIEQVLQQFDAFPKVADNVREQGWISGAVGERNACAPYTRVHSDTGCYRVECVVGRW